MILYNTTVGVGVYAGEGVEGEAEAEERRGKHNLQEGRLIN